MDLQVYSGCGTTKGCVGETEGCVNAKNCTLLTTYQGSSKSDYLLEIYGILTQENNYIASALSLDDKMGEDSVMACILDRETGKMKNDYLCCFFLVTLTMRLQPIHILFDFPQLQIFCK